MTEKDYLIIDPNGMHARPATALLRLSRQFSSEIVLAKDGKSIQLKSMLNILSLALKYGDKVSLKVEGEDETEAVKALDTFFNEEMKNF